MSKCELTIQLDDPDQVRWGGDSIQGVVHVEALADVKCNGLTIETNWKTHGRGNVASGDAVKQVLFVGQWTQGQREQYPFEIQLLDGPPTYHGHYINVDHYLTANVDVPWAFDPKVSLPIPLRIGKDSSFSSTPSRPEASRTIGCLILSIVSIAFLAASAAIGVIAIAVVVGVILIAVILWIVGSVMPKWKLGNVDVQWDGEAVVGQPFRGRLVLDPKRPVSVGPATLKWVGAERAVSGSGSNRTTHRHELFSHSVTLAERIDLKSGVRTEIPIEIMIPDDTAASFHLGDNELQYRCDFRIQIDRWPDWRRKIPIAVISSADDGVRSASTSGSDLDSGEPFAGGSDGPPAISFAELAELLWAHRESAEDREQLISAVEGLVLPISAQIERRLLYTGQDSGISPDDYAVWAHAVNSPLPMVLFIRHDRGDEFESMGDEPWRGRGEVLGWDTAHRRLKIRVVGD